MSWDFADNELATAPSSAAHADFSFWCWFKIDTAGRSVDAILMRENSARIVIQLENSASWDDIVVTRSGTSGSVTVDLSANSITVDDTWVFFGIAFSADTTVDRVVLGDESTDAFEATYSNTLSGNAFNSSNSKSIGNSDTGSLDLIGLIHSFGYHDDPLTLAEFESARENFDQSAHATYTFLLDDTAAPWSVTAQSGSGTLTSSSVTYSSDAPSLGGTPQTVTSVATALTMGATSHSVSGAANLEATAVANTAGATSHEVAAEASVAATAVANTAGATSHAVSAAAESASTAVANTMGVTSHDAAVSAVPGGDTSVAQPITTGVTSHDAAAGATSTSSAVANTAGATSPGVAAGAAQATTASAATAGVTSHVASAAATVTSVAAGLALFATRTITDPASTVIAAVEHYLAAIYRRRR